MHADNDAAAEDPITCCKGVPVAFFLDAWGIEVLTDDVQVQGLQRRNGVIPTPDTTQEAVFDWRSNRLACPTAGSRYKIETPRRERKQKERKKTIVTHCTTS